MEQQAERIDGSTSLKFVSLQASGRQQPLLSANVRHPLFSIFPPFLPLEAISVPHLLSSFSSPLLS